MRELFLSTMRGPIRNARSNAISPPPVDRNQLSPPPLTQHSRPAHPTGFEAQRAVAATMRLLRERQLSVAVETGREIEGGTGIAGPERVATPPVRGAGELDLTKGVRGEGSGSS